MRQRKKTLLVMIILLITLCVISLHPFVTPSILPTCQNEYVEDIALYLEQGISNVYMYGTSDQYENYLDGSLLDMFIQYTGTQPEHNQASSFYATKNLVVKDVRVIACGFNRIWYHARIEQANVVIDKESQEIRIPCFGSAMEGVYVIIKINGAWKYTKGGSTDVDSSTHVETLRQNVCAP